MCVEKNPNCRARSRADDVSNVKYLMLLCLSITAATHVFASCDGEDLNGDGLCESYRVESVGEISQVSIDIGGMDKRVSGFFDLGRGGLYKGYFSGEMSMALDYYPTNTQIKTYSFRWSPELKDWVLYRTAFWEELYRDEKFVLRESRISAGLEIPRSFNVKRIPCCIKFSDFAHDDFALSPMKIELQKKEIHHDFKRIRKYISDTGKNIIFTSREVSDSSQKTLPDEFIFELTLILDAKNVVDINNLAYYLLEGGHITSAVILLREIHRKFPHRIVAILNLADAYQELEMNSEACILYAKYIEEMHAAGHSNQIPQRLSDSLACALK